MRKMRALELLPFFALIAAAAIVSSAALAVAAFSFPDLLSKYSFGQPASAGNAYAPGTTTTVTNAYLPLNDMSMPFGFSVPTFSNFRLFGAPYTSERSYTRTAQTPDGPRTQVVDEKFDGSTGQRITTVTNL